MYNKVIMIGNLTRDIEFQYLQNSNTPVAKSAIATSYRYKQQSGEQKEETCFLDFTIFGRVAEVANQYLHKGSKVMLEGRLVLDQWVGTDGQNKSKHSLRVDTMKMLGGKEENPNALNSPEINQPLQNDYQHIQKTKELPNIEITEDDIPF